MTDHGSTSDAAPHQKATLFCARCGHESHVAGDWLVHERGGRDVYECPDCGATITNRQAPPPCVAD